MDLFKLLQNKSVEELILISLRGEDFVDRFMEPMKKSIVNIVSQTSQMIGKKLIVISLYLKLENSDKIKTEYNNFIESLRDKRIEYENLMKEYSNLKLEKEKSSMVNYKSIKIKKFTTENIVKELSIFIEEELNKPKKKIINDFMKKEISFESFQNQIKDINTKYHYYSILKSKLNSNN